MKYFHFGSRYRQPQITRRPLRPRFAPPATLSAAVSRPCGRLTDRGRRHRWQGAGYACCRPASDLMYVDVSAHHAFARGTEPLPRTQSWLSCKYRARPETTRDGFHSKKMLRKGFEFASAAGGRLWAGQRQTVAARLPIASKWTPVSLALSPRKHRFHLGLQRGGVERLDDVVADPGFLRGNDVLGL